MKEKQEELAKKGFLLLQNLLTDEYPYLAPLIYALQGKADWEEPCMGTDGRTVFYSPEYLIEKLGKKSSGYKELKECYLQMLAHCLLGHVWQLPPENKCLWDCCCDLSAELLACDITGKTPQFTRRQRVSEMLEKLKIVSAEALYSFEEESDIFSSVVIDTGEMLKRDTHLRWRSAASQEKEKADGSKNSQREAMPLASQTKENQAAAGMEEWDQLRNLVLSMLPSEISDSIRAGLNLVGYSENVIASEENESDYQKILRKYSTLKERKVEDFEALDYGWYSLGLELYGNIPLIEYPESSEQQTVDDIVVAIDVSGSCGGETACRFLRETCNLIRDMGIGTEAVNIRILECDDEIRRETVIHTSDDIPDFSEREVEGFGGTSFVPVFNRIQKLRDEGEIRNVRCLLYLSDGFGDFPHKEPDYDVIFVLEQDCMGFGYYGMPDWVKTVQLTEKDFEICPDDEYDFLN